MAAYLTYKQYQALGHSSLDSASFPEAEAWAEAVLDEWTLDRLHVVDWTRWADRVQAVAARLADSMSEVEAAEGGQAVQSFSNGQDSYTFADPTENAALAAVHRYALRVLPIDLTSACVRYNGAHRA